MRLRVAPPSSVDEAHPALQVVGLLLSLLLGGVLFIVLWAVLNFAFGTALDGPIGGFVMEPPCQRLADTTEPLAGYTLGRSGRGRSSPAVCNFASRSVIVDGPTNSLGFPGREFVFLLIGFAGYGVCLTCALVATVFLVRGGRRLVRGVMRRAGAHPR